MYQAFIYYINSAAMIILSELTTRLMIVYAEMVESLKDQHITTT